MKAVEVGRQGDVGPRQWLAALAVVSVAHVLVAGWLAGREPVRSPPAALRIIEASLLPPPGPAAVKAEDSAPPAEEPPVVPAAEPEPPLPEPAWDVEPAPPPPVAASPKATARARPKAAPVTAARPRRDSGVGTASDGARGEASGGSATAPRHDAAYLSNPPPAYPAAARRRGLEGRVLIHAQVAASGECVTAAVSRSSGHAVLDEAALQAVRKWRFVPATRDGRPVAAGVEIPIVFRLEG